MNILSSKYSIVYFLSNKNIIHDSKYHIFKIPHEYMIHRMQESGYLSIGYSILVIQFSHH